MKVVILAGGFGTRLSEYTDSIPKPMVTIGGKPIIEHIINIYQKYGHNDFFVATGYKSQIIENYFKNYPSKSKIHLINTGSETLTGGRIKRLEKFLKNEPFFLTYGDGLSDINLDNLLKFHKNNKKIITVTAVRPPARFGALTIQNNAVTEFNEKVNRGDNWINGGFFVAQPEFLQFINSDDTVLEKEPLENVSRIGELMAYQHDGFWQCMDTKRDRDFLEKQYRLGHVDVFYR